MYSYIYICIYIYIYIWWRAEGGGARGGRGGGDPARSGVECLSSQSPNPETLRSAVKVKVPCEGLKSQNHCFSFSLVENAAACQQLRSSWNSKPAFFSRQTGRRAPAAAACGRPDSGGVACLTLPVSCRLAADTAALARKSWARGRPRPGPMAVKAEAPKAPAAEDALGQSLQDAGPRGAGEGAASST